MLKDGAFFEIDLKMENSKLWLHPEKQNLVSTIEGIVQEGYNQIISNASLNQLFESLFRAMESIPNRKPSPASSVLTYIGKCITMGRRDRKQPIHCLIQQIEQDFDKLKEHVQQYYEYEEVNEQLESVSKQLENLSMYTSNSVEDNLALFKSVKRIHGKLSSFPAGKIHVGDTLQLNMLSLYEPMRKSLDAVLLKIKTKYIEHIEQDLSDLKLEIMKNIQVIQADPQTIEDYITRVQNIEQFIDRTEFHKTNLRLFDEVGKYIKEILKGEYDNKFDQLLRDVRESLRKSPEILRGVAEKIQKSKKKTVYLTQKSFKEFQEKMIDFKRRYVNSYFKDKDKLAAPEATIKELEQRDDNINDINQRLLAYLSFDSESYINRIKERGIPIHYIDDREKSLETHENEKDKDDRITHSDLTKTFEGIKVLHKETKKLWKILAYWSQRRKKFMSLTFDELDIKQVYHIIAKVRKYLNDDVFDPDHEDFGRYARGIHRGLLDKIEELEKGLDKVSVMKKESIPESQWKDIIRLLGYEMKTFTLEMLLENPKFEKSFEKIQEMLKEVNSDAKFKGVINKVYDAWQIEEVPFKLYKDVYIVNKEKAMDIINNKLDEYKITVQQVSSREASLSSVMKQRLQKLTESLRFGEEVIRKLVECDEEYVKAEILEEELVRKKNSVFESFLNEFEDSIARDVKKTFADRKCLIEKVKADRMFLSSLTRDKIEEFVDRLDNIISTLRNSWHDVRRLLNKKRETFTRLYFLDDIGIISLYKSLYESMEKPGVLRVLFPGIWRLEMKEESRGEKGKPSVEVEIGAAPSEGTKKTMGMKHMNAEERRRALALQQNREEIAKIARANNIGELRLMATKEGINVENTLIHGLVDGNYEVFKLRSPILIKNKRLEDILKSLEVVFII